MVVVGGRSALEAALARASGPVTTFLEQLVGEPIDAHDRRHRMAAAASSNDLHVPDGHPLLDRSAVLRGRTSGRPYVAAETLLVVSRLPGTVRERLEVGSDPIGRVFEEEGIAFTRGPIVPADRAPHGLPPEGDGVAEECLLARSYRVDVDGSPVMKVSEWFLSPLEEFLTDH
jgi:chorismate-pyruvate lyase